jgi:hypothetical protein
MNIKLKFKIGQTVWFMHDNRIVSDTVRIINVIISDNKKEHISQIYFNRIQRDSKGYDYYHYCYNVYASKEEIISVIAA